MKKLLPKFLEGGYYLVKRENGDEYKIYPSAIKSKEINVTTPEIIVKGKAPGYRSKLITNSAYHPEDAETFFNLTGIGTIFNPFRLTLKSLNFLDKPSKETIKELAPEVLPYSRLGRLALGGYGLANKNGVYKTYQHLKNNEYSNAAMSALGDLLNASMIPQGAKMFGKGIKTLAKMDMPRFGYKPSTLNYFKPGYAGMNNFKTEKSTEILSQALKDKGWKLEGNIYIDPKGNRFIRNTEGKLQSEKSIMETLKAKISQARNKKDLNAFSNKIKTFNQLAAEFYNESGLDFSLDNWERLASGYKMSQKEKEIYMTQAYPKFVDTFRQIFGKQLIKKDGRWYGHFDTPVGLVLDKLPILKDKWAAGFRELLGNPLAMIYVINKSPLGKDKFIHNGITMYEGVPKKYKEAFINGENNQTFPKWFNSNISGASAYSNPDHLKIDPGLLFYGLPIKPSKVYNYMKDDVHLIKRQTSHPTSNSWNGLPNSPIGSFLEKNPEKKIHISEGPLKDDLASTVNNSEINGVFTIVGENIPVKSAFGGTGMYDIKGSNLYKPFALFVIPTGLATTLGIKYDNKTKKQVR